MVVEHLFANVTERDKTYEAIKSSLGLDLPIHVQYGRWIGGIVTRGDFGTSLWRNSPVIEEIFQRLPVSMELGIMAIIIALLIAFPIGIYSAIRQDTIGDYIGRTINIIFISVPFFWTGVMVVVFSSIWFRWIPPIEYVSFLEDPLTNLEMFIIPALILGSNLSGITMRMTRTMMLEVLRQDYIRTAWAKGLRERVVITRHALRNALIPVVTIIGVQIPVVIGGAVIAEQIFVLPGIGRLTLDAIGSRDYPIISGVNLVIACTVLLNNLLIDLTYSYIDPRIRYK